MKEYSLDKMTFIAKGGTGSIYRINDEQIIKIYNNISVKKLEERKHWARELFKAGVPTAISFETVVVGDKYGIIFELFHSKTVGQQLIENPEKLEQSGIKMGKLLKTIHSCKIDDLKAKTIKHLIIQWAKVGVDHGLLNLRDVRSIKEILDAVPDANSLLHCDFHEGNVMIQNDEYLLIDIDDSCIGHPLFDLALHYLNHDLLSYNPKLLFLSLGITPKIAKKMAKLTRDYYFKDMDPKRKKIYIKLCKSLLPLLMVTSSARALDNPEFVNEKNQKFIKYVLVPVLHLNKKKVIKNLNKLRQIEGELL